MQKRGMWKQTWIVLDNDCLKRTHSFESSNVLRRGPREGEKKELRNRRGSPGCEKDFSFRCPVPLIEDIIIEATMKDRLF